VATTVTLSGTQTVRWNYDSGDADYLLFVPTGTTTPKFSSIVKNADGTITITWTGGGALQGAASVDGPWQNLPTASSPYTFTPTSSMLFGRIKL